MRIAAVSALLVLGGLGAPRLDAAATEAMPVSSENKQRAFRDSMRKLWAEHVIWTREYIVAAIAGNADLADVGKRLLKNQSDIGEVFALYYGKEAGVKIAEVLKQHVLIAGEVVDGAKTGNKGKLQDSSRRWRNNANDVAIVLSAANPTWSKTTLEGMLSDHLALTTMEMEARLNKRWPDDIAAFDKSFEQAMIMADDLSSGIIKQFPKRF